MGLHRTAAALLAAWTLVACGGGGGDDNPAPTTPSVDGVVVKIALPHNALAADRARGRYYASVPGSVVQTGNRIAVIDAQTGAISYPGTAVGSDPGAMALSADGQALYVGLAGSGEIVKLRLPDMATVWRATLPVQTSFGQLFAEQIAVSPTDADVIAVSMFRKNVSPRHGGVALVRGGVLQPTMTPDHTGSNLIAFDANGQSVYGFNNETTEFGLRRLSVLPDGLRQDQVVTALGDFGTRTLDASPQGLVLGTAVYRAPALTLAGQVNLSGAACRPDATVASRLLCSSHVSSASRTGDAIAIVDAGSFVIQSVLVYEPGSEVHRPVEIVPGAAGQVAIRMGRPDFLAAAEEVWLFTAATLR